jgi:hypothetical protein
MEVGVYYTSGAVSHCDEGHLVSCELDAMVCGVN